MTLYARIHTSANTHGHGHMGTGMGMEMAVEMDMNIKYQMDMEMDMDGLDVNNSVRCAIGRGRWLPEDGIVSREGKETDGSGRRASEEAIGPSEASESSREGRGEADEKDKASRDVPRALTGRTAEIVRDECGSLLLAQRSVAILCHANDGAPVISSRNVKQRRAAAEPQQSRS